VGDELDRGQGPDSLRRIGGEKWRRYPAGVLPSFVADMDFPAADAVQDAIEALVENRAYGYPWPNGLEPLAGAFARYQSEAFGWEVEPARVRPTTDVVQSIAACLLAFSEPGDGVAVQTPAYPPFLTVTASCSRLIAESPLLDTGERFELDVGRLRSAVDERTRILLLCHPHNPTGRVFDADELAAIAELAAERDLVVVSDEIHADLVYPGRTHVPFASLGPETAARTVTVTSATKGYNLAGLRCSVAYFGADEICERFDRAIPLQMLGQITHISSEATLAAWSGGRSWLARLLETLDANRSYVLERLENDLPQLRCYAPEATYFAWIDCSALGLDGLSPVSFFLEHAKVAMKGGTDFGEPGGDFVRLNFATTRRVLDEILDRMTVAVRSLTQTAKQGAER
jgi:cystathionine beta-lyase